MTSPSCPDAAAARGLRACMGLAVPGFEKTPELQERGCVAWGVTGCKPSPYVPTVARLQATGTGTGRGACGLPAARQALQPPRSARARVMPRALGWSREMAMAAQVAN